MSKQKIREWLVDNTGCFYDDARVSMGEVIDIIHKYTKDQSGWVNIKERLPEPNQKVLTVSGDGRIFYTVFLKGQSKHTFSCMLSVHDHDNVTHWMPLPLPPTEEA